MRELEIGDTLDGLEIEALVARGGMATIYKAVELASGRPVALKVPHIRFESDVVFYERFRREEEAALGLDHPAVVKALPARGEKSRTYMLLEWVDGIPLSALAGDGRTLHPARALDIARQLCDALAYLHARGVVHRDLKPGNVLLAPDGRVRILDLGLAHVEGARRLTVPGLSASSGTPGYMAPEQLRGKTGDARVDLHALGTILYEMLTGRLPYEPDDWDALLRLRRPQQPPPPSRFAPDLDPAVDAIVMKAIEPDPDDRYATAVDLLADLRNPAAAAPLPAARPPAPARRGVDPRRAAAWIVVVATLFGLSSFGWFAWRRAAESAAEAASATAAPR